MKIAVNNSSNETFKGVSYEKDIPKWRIEQVLKKAKELGIKKVFSINKSAGVFNSLAVHIGCHSVSHKGMHVSYCRSLADAKKLKSALLTNGLLVNADEIEITDYTKNGSHIIYYEMALEIFKR